MFPFDFFESTNMQTNFAVESDYLHDDDYFLPEAWLSDRSAFKQALSKLPWVG